MKTLIKFIILFYPWIFFNCTSVENIHEIADYVNTNQYQRHKFNYDTVSIGNIQYEILNPYKHKQKLWLKGSMHNHTDNSAHVDGYGSGDPIMTVYKFRDLGLFDFYCLTDHNYATPVENVENIVCVGKALEDTQHHHLIVYNLPEDYEYTFISNNINEQIEYYHSIGAFVSYAHPDWSGSYQENNKILSVKDVDFVEVYNTVEGGSVRAYNILMQNIPVMAFGTDDYHFSAYWENPDQYFNKSYIYVNCESRTKDNIWKSILSGNFYASTGAKMDINMDNGVISVSSDLPSTIEFLAPDPNNIGHSICLHTEQNSTNAKYSIKGNEIIVWIRLTNYLGQSISQPFRIKII